MRKVDSHSRMINKDFLNDLSKDGFLSPVTELVRKHQDELMMAFRGDYINIYYRGHSLYKIEKQVQAYKVTFDFNHSRYTKEHDSILKKLMNLGMQLPSQRKEVKYESMCFYIDKAGKEKKKLTSSSGKNLITKKIPVASEDIDKKFWDNSYKLLKQAIDDYFDPEKKEDYFKDASCKGELSSKKLYLEKQRQQSIALANRATENGYFVYDIEYSQPNEKQGDEKSGCFDLLALKFEGQKAKQLLLIEVKTTKEACTGSSGVDKHKEDMDKYITNTEVINVRRKEAEDVMAALDKLFQIGKVDFSEIEKNVRCVFVYTDEAQKFKGASNNEFLDAPWELKNI